MAWKQNFRYNVFEVKVKYLMGVGKKRKCSADLYRQVWSKEEQNKAKPSMMGGLN